MYIYIYIELVDFYSACNIICWLLATCSEVSCDIMQLKLHMYTCTTFQAAYVHIAI